MSYQFSETTVLKNSRVLLAQEPIDFSPDMSVSELFLRLTSKTCPFFEYCDTWHDTYEVLLYGETLIRLGFRHDPFGNFHYIIPKKDGTPSRTVFVSHLDTVSNDSPSPVPVKHIFSAKKTVVWSNGRTILGADNKSGMTVLLKLIDAGVPGHYIFTIAEEAGCFGAYNLVREQKDLKTWPWYDWANYDRVISFDREGTRDIITHMRVGRTCSTAFAREVARRINDQWEGFEYAACDRGSMTDSGVWAFDVAECTNISTGMFSTHTKAEFQSLGFLRRLISAAIHLDWETLPVQRKLATLSL